MLNIGKAILSTTVQRIKPRFCIIGMSKPKTMNHVFIPGKNWRLSLAELLSFFEARKCSFRILDISKSHFVVAGDESLGSCIDELGGTTKIGRAITIVPSEIVNDAFLRRKKEAQIEFRTRLSSNLVFDEVFKASPDRRLFGVSLYFENPVYYRVSRMTQRFLGSYFKKELEAHGIKSKFMGFPRNRKLPQLTQVEVLKKGLMEKSAEILLCIGEEQTIIAKTTSVHNPFEFQKRDVERPVQRRIFAIPPRLAKIMLNLSSCSSGKILLDPFCGVGTILQEAILAKAHVMGSDIDPWCIEASRKNLEWLKGEYGLKDAKYTVMVGDARNLTKQIGKETVDCIATEPDLGPALRHLPTVSYANKIFGKLKPLYFDFLEQANEVLKRGGKLVFVAPYIRTRVGEFVALNIDEEAGNLGFKATSPFEKGFFAEGNRLFRTLVGTSCFVDMEKRHKIGREIHILQK